MSIVQRQGRSLTASANMMYTFADVECLRPVCMFESQGFGPEIRLLSAKRPPSVALANSDKLFDAEYAFALSPPWRK
jgi:hypothetical protein